MLQLFDDLIINCIASYCTYKEVETLIIISGNCNDNERCCQLFGDIFPEYCAMYGKRMDTIINSPKWLYIYADNKILKRLPIGLEQVIITSAKYSYLYAVNVIEHRWGEDTKAEEIIKKDDEYACLYAAHVIRGKWNDDEVNNRILNNPDYAYYYASQVMRLPVITAEVFGKYTSKTNVIDVYKYCKMLAYRRIPELEPLFATSAEYACAYAQEISRCRWDINSPIGQEAERKICTKANFAYSYAETIIRGRWGVNSLGEQIISDSPYYSYMYAIRIIRHRWEIDTETGKNAEKNINKSKKYSSLYDLMFRCKGP